MTTTCGAITARRTRRRASPRSRARADLPAIEWCGGVYSSEWGFAKLLHWLRHNPDKRGQFVTALEHCDMVAAVLCGVTEPSRVPRSVCAMGHKWLWSERLGGFPPEEFLTAVDPLLAGVRDEARRRNIARRITSPDICSARGPSDSDCAPAFRFRSARSTRTGTRSARA